MSEITKFKRTYDKIQLDLQLTQLIKVKKSFLLFVAKNMDMIFQVKGSLVIML